MTKRAIILSWKNGTLNIGATEHPAGTREIDLTEAATVGGGSGTVVSPKSTLISGYGCNWNSVRMTYCSSICYTYLYPSPATCYTKNGAPGCPIGSF